jgi:hypothetical protein
MPPGVDGSGPQSMRGVDHRTLRRAGIKRALLVKGHYSSVVGEFLLRVGYRAASGGNPNRAVTPAESAAPLRHQSAWVRLSPVRPRRRRMGTMPKRLQGGECMPGLDICASWRARAEGALLAKKQNPSAYAEFLLHLRHRADRSPLNSSFWFTSIRKTRGESTAGDSAGRELAEAMKYQ